MSKVAIQGNASGSGVLTLAAPNTNSDRTLTLPDNSGTLVAKASTYISPSELGSGTPSASNFLRGDGSWQVINTTPTTDQVLTAAAGASAGAVGTYAFLATSNGASSTEFGSTLAGSSLMPVGVANAPNATTAVSLATSGSVSGTWRAMGFKGARIANNASAREATLWLRIS
jgi:hypothetical protein